MRHGNKINHLGRKHGHRSALLKNLSASLIEHKRINTTLAKARELRKYLEPLVTKSKDNTTHSRRVIFAIYKAKTYQRTVCSDSSKIMNRPGGYLRVIKTGWRSGDAAEMALIEFVDFNEVYVNGTKPAVTESTEKKKKTRRGSGKKAISTAEVITEVEGTPTEADTQE
jgi:large subunit ribosomal protein L17